MGDSSLESQVELTVMIRLSRHFFAAKPVSQFCIGGGVRISKFEQLRMATQRKPLPAVGPKINKVEKKKTEKVSTKKIKGDIKRILDEEFTHDYDPKLETLEQIALDLSLTTEEVVAWYEKQRKIYDLGVRRNGQVKQKKLQKPLKREIVMTYKEDSEKINKEMITQWSKDHHVTRESIQRFIYKIKDVDKNGRFESYFFQKDKKGEFLRI